MPSINNIGGSLTSAVILTLLAWGVRVLRATAQRQGTNSQRRGSKSDLQASLGRFFAALSPAALRMLVETDPVPHLVVDVRSAEAAADAPLPPELSGAVQIPQEELQAAFSTRDAAWAGRFGGVPAQKPTRDHVLVFVGDSEDAMRAGACAAAAAGFQRTAVLQGDLAAFSSSAHTQANLRYINRDALAVLLGLAGSTNPGAPPGAVLDIRRYDERTLYGSIPGTKHIPADQLPSALRLSEEQWQQQYRFPKPRPHDPVVMQCRTNRRAAWAAQLAQDAGLQNCLVYRQGVYGWHLDPGIKAYKSYEKWDPPPDPEPFTVDEVNVAAACEELAELGL